MSNQQSGLRFDIYERVHLPEHHAGIEELNEVELVPQIQVVTEGEHAVLRGNLLLAGQYQAIGEIRSEQSISYLIPVEITLPMDRVQNLEQISVSIDNFDIDLLSSRSLNVTGVLSLNGIHMSNDTDQKWEEDEEVIFVHAPEREMSVQAESGKKKKTEYSPDNEDEHGNETEEVLEEDYNELDDLDQYEDQSASDSDEVPDTQTEDNQGMKIAFGSIKNDDDHKQLNSTDLKSLLHLIPKTETKENRKEEMADSAKQGETVHAHTVGTDTVEWKKLFISTEPNSEKFRKMRMCIVQKDETLESIALKYDLKPQEIRLYNRMNEQEVREGQVLYIP